MSTILVLIFLALSVVGSVFLIRKNRASGGCSGNCASCRGCNGKR